MFIIKLVFFLLSYIIGALAGSYAGAEGTEKNVRRIGIPVMITFGAIAVLYIHFGAVAWFALTIMSMCGVFAIGYGIPDDTDEGSALGKFWYKITNKNHFLADVFTRLTIGIACSVSLLSIPLISNLMVAYLIGCAIIIFHYVMFGAIIKNEGTFIFCNKECLFEEAYIYGAISGVAGILLLII